MFTHFVPPDSLLALSHLQIFRLPLSRLRAAHEGRVVSAIHEVFVALDVAH